MTRHQSVSSPRDSWFLFDSGDRTGFLCNSAWNTGIIIEEDSDWRQMRLGRGLLGWSYFFPWAQLDKTWGCSEGPGDSIQYKFGETAVPLSAPDYQAALASWGPGACMSSRARGEGEDRSDTAWESSFNWLTSRKQCQGQNHSSEADVVPSTCKLVLSEITRKTLMRETTLVVVTDREYQIRSDQISRSVVSNSLRPHESQHARPSCPSPTPGVHWDSTSIESVMPSSHLILCRPLLLLPPIPPSIRVFSNESTLRMRCQSTGV